MGLDGGGRGVSKSRGSGCELRRTAPCLRIVPFIHRKYGGRAARASPRRAIGSSVTGRECRDSLGALPGARLRGGTRAVLEGAGIGTEFRRGTARARLGLRTNADA